jgi:hypothetical protein
MEIRDGFIVGIYSYCDGWCGACAFTSYCRLFADKCETEAAVDPNLQPIVDAPPLPSEQEPPPPKWFQELIEEINEAALTKGPEVLVRSELVLPADHLAISDRADLYCRRARAWLKDREREGGRPEDPIAVIGWFYLFIHVKVMRALRGLAEDDPSMRDWPPDHDGSAKVALVGIDRSLRAWFELMTTGGVSAAEALPCIDDLMWLTDVLERTFPNARAFVRPGFDEPEEVAKLVARGE